MSRGVFGNGGSNSETAVCHVTGSSHASLNARIHGWSTLE